MSTNDDIYFARLNWGHCKVCGNWQDLRCGSCFSCSEHVEGMVLYYGGLGNRIHELWDSRNTDNRWYTDDNGNVIELP